MTSIQKSIPAEIHAFFKTACGKSPFSEQAGKGIAYCAEGSSISIRPDSYGGCHIDVEGQFSPPQLQKVRAAIEALTASFRKSGAFDSVWINRPLPTDVRSLGLLAPESFCIGMQGKSDLVYDYKERKARFWQWINEQKKCTIPSGPCYKMGATALILDRVARKVLLVVNEHRSDAWNLPGGGYDPFKDSSTSDTALREAEEEGGFAIEGRDRLEPILVGQMQFPFNQFAPSLNQTWAYFLDGVSKKELHPPKGEIRIAKWISFHEIEESNGTLEGFKLGDEIKSTLRAALRGLGFERIGNKKQMVVHAPVSRPIFNSIATLQELAKNAKSLGTDEWGILALDFDQTLVRAKPGLGDGNCSKFLRKHHRMHGIDEHIHYKWNVQVRDQVSYEACEPVEGVNRVIRMFREKGWTVKILTSRGLDMKEMTGRHLKESGLDFILEDVIFKESHPDGGGRLLAKDESLEKWMAPRPERHLHKKTRILFLDDLEKSCHEVARLSKRLRDSDVTCLQYRGCQADPELSEEQRNLCIVQLHAIQNGRPLFPHYTREDLAKALLGLKMHSNAPEELYRAILRGISACQSP